MKKAVLVLSTVLLAFMVSCTPKSEEPARIKAEEPRISRVFDDPEYYAAFPEIIQQGEQVILNFEVQPMEPLQNQKLHPHYRPLTEWRYMTSDDYGKTWVLSSNCPMLDNLNEATRVLTPVSKSEILDTRYHYVPGTTDLRPLTARIHRYSLSQPPVHEEPLGPAPGVKWYVLWDVVRMADGSLLAAGYGPTEEIPATFAEGVVYNENLPENYRHDTIVLFKADANGRNWRYFSQMENPHVFGYGEPGLLAFPDGRVVVFIRTEWNRRFGELLPDDAHGYGREQKGYGYYIYQAESVDGGRTWSPAEKLGLWGHPPYAFRLRDGSVMLLFGHRREPYSIHAVMSFDEARTWDLSTHKPIYTFEPGNYDIGYPVGVELPDGRVLAAFYGYSTEEVDKLSPHGIFTAIFDPAWLREN